MSGGIYTVYRRPGWHGEPTDPVVTTTDDEREAALLAGVRVDHRMPGGSDPHPHYALDSDGEPVEEIESYACDACDELHPWMTGEPIGVLNGEVLPEVGGVEGHRLDWLCEACALDECWRLAGGCTCERCDDDDRAPAGARSPGTLGLLGPKPRGEGAGMSVVPIRDAVTEIASIPTSGAEPEVLERIAESVANYAAAYDVMPAARLAHYRAWLHAARVVPEIRRRRSAFIRRIRGNMTEEASLKAALLARRADRVSERQPSPELVADLWGILELLGGCEPVALALVEGRPEPLTEAREMTALWCAAWWIAALGPIPPRDNPAHTSILDGI